MHLNLAHEAHLKIPKMIMDSSKNVSGWIIPLKKFSKISVKVTKSSICAQRKY